MHQNKDAYHTTCAQKIREPGFYTNRTTDATAISAIDSPCQTHISKQHSPLLQWHRQPRWSPPQILEAAMGPSQAIALRESRLSGGEISIVQTRNCQSGLSECFCLSLIGMTRQQSGGPPLTSLSSAMPPYNGGAGVSIGWQECVVTFASRRHVLALALGHHGLTCPADRSLSDCEDSASVGFDVHTDSAAVARPDRAQPEWLGTISNRTAAPVLSGDSGGGGVERTRSGDQRSCSPSRRVLMARP